MPVPGHCLPVCFADYFDIRTAIGVPCGGRKMFKLTVIKCLNIFIFWSFSKPFKSMVAALKVVLVGMRDLASFHYLL